MLDSRGASAGALVESLSSGSLTWVYLERATELEAEVLAHRYGIPATLLAEALAGQPVTRPSESGACLLVVASTPVASRLSHQIVLETASLIVGRGFVCSMHQGDARPLARLFRDCQNDERRRDSEMATGAVGLAAQILGQLADPAIQQAEATRVAARQISQELASGDDGDLVPDLVHAGRNTSALLGCLREARTALALLAQLPAGSSGDEAAGLVRAVRGRVDRGLESLELTREDLATLTQGAGVLATQRAAAAARLAAGLLAVTLPALVVSALFGVSFADMPLAGYAYGFEVVLGLSIAAGLIALWLLRRKRWL